MYWMCLINNSECFASRWTACHPYFISYNHYIQVKHLWQLKAHLSDKMTEIKTGLWTCHRREISGPGWSVSRCPGAALCFHWSAGSGPSSLGTMSAPSSSVCRHAPPRGARSITQRSHCNRDPHWQGKLCANQTSWAVIAHRVKGWNAVSWQPTHGRQIPALVVRVGAN